jgi:hypothetical protein
MAELPLASHIDYDSMSEDEYFRAMEQKVAFYKDNFPDMYNKAVQWMSMLNDSQIYQANVPSDPKNRVTTQQRSHDILKNALFQGWSEEDIPEKDKAALDEWFPQWKDDLEKNSSEPSVPSDSVSAPSVSSDSAPSVSSDSAPSVSSDSAPSVSSDSAPSVSSDSASNPL